MSDALAGNGSGRARGTVLLALAAVFGVALFASTMAQGPPVWMLLQPVEATRVEIVATLALLWGGALVLVTVAAAVVRIALRSRRPQPPTYGAVLMRGLPIATASLAVVSLATIGWIGPSGSGGMGAGAERTGEGSERRGPGVELIDWWNSAVLAGEDRRQAADPATPGGVSDNRQFLLLMLGLLLAAVLLGLLAWQWYARTRTGQGSRTGEGAAGEPQPGDVHDAVVSTIDAMLANPDPRAAIIGAYARLLEGLSACGAGRQDHEAPFEHLHRVLAVLHVRPEPMRRLTELFSVARFSTHPLTPSDREEALAALRAIAVDLGDRAGIAPDGGVRPEMAQS